MADRLTINPDVLVWARERMNLEQEDVARFAGTPVRVYQQWETGELGPTYKQLRKVAFRLRVRVTAFVRSELPQDTWGGIIEARSLFGQSVNPSYKLLCAIDDARNRRAVYLELRDSPPPAFLPAIDRSASVSDAVHAVRRRLRVPDVLPVFADGGVAFRFWNDLVEATGTLVSQSSGIPVEEYRGLALHHAIVPLILLNGSDAMAARLFTLMHEFVHLALGADDWSTGNGPTVVSGAVETLEQFCNAVAAGVLMPEHPVRALAASHPDDPMQAVERVAKRFGTSKVAAAVRLVELRLAPRKVYLAVRKQQPAKKTGGGGPLHHVRVTRNNGVEFTRTALDAYWAGVVPDRDVPHIFNLPVEKLDLVERVLWR